MFLDCLPVCFVLFYLMHAVQTSRIAMVRANKKLIKIILQDSVISCNAVEVSSQPKLMDDLW